MKFSSILLVTGILFASISLGSVAKDGKVYTWKDSKGVVHYGEHPPKDVQAKLVKTRTGHSDPLPVPPTTPAPPQTVTAQEANNEESFKDPDRCSKAKHNLDVLNSGAPIRTRNDAGATVIMDEAEKTKQRNMYQLVINQAC